MLTQAPNLDLILYSSDRYKDKHTQSLNDTLSNRTINRMIQRVRMIACKTSQIEGR